MGEQSCEEMIQPVEVEACLLRCEPVTWIWNRKKWPFNAQKTAHHRHAI
jgi:hypothetical protein